MPSVDSESLIVMKLFPDSNIYLSCNFDGIPEPDVQWLRNDVNVNVLDLRSSVLTVNRSSSLTYFDQRGVSGGHYVCEVSNIAGLATFNFTVHCK